MPSHVLLRTPELTLGQFECAPGDPLWDEVNTNMGAWPHVVFPRTPVLIAQEGAWPALVTPNHVVFYKPHQLSGRAIRDGDRCLWLEVSPELWCAPDAPAGRATRGRSCLRSRSRGISSPSRCRIGCWPRRRYGCCAPGAPSVARAPERTRREHAELAEAAKEWLAARSHEPLSLAAVAGALYVSPFHLARVFRARTGFSLTGYVHGLRLRGAVERLADEPGVELSRLALELGYCSPSHFSDRFRAVGVPPPWRGTELRTIVEARAPPRLRTAPVEEGGRECVR